MPREVRPFLLIIALLVAAALLLEFLNGRFWLSDFRVYWSAADALVHGRAVYGVPFGEDTGFYKYAPIVAIAFVPAALLPFKVAATIHFLLIGVALGWSFVRMEHLLMRHISGTFPPRIFLRAMLGLLCIVVLLARELHLGNVNLWLVLLVIIATEALLEGNQTFAGILFGALWLTKPYLMLIAIPLAARMRWRALSFAAATVLVGITIPFIALGPRSAFLLNMQWIEAMREHSTYLISPDTLVSMLHRSRSPAPPWLGLLFIAAVAAFLAWWSGRRSPASSPQASAMNEAVGIWAAFALVPNLVITDQEHFLFALPLIVFMLAHLFTKWDPLVLVLFLVGVALYSLRSTDLWGSAIENRIAGMGALGIGNLMLVCAAFLSARRWRTAT